MFFSSGDFLNIIQSHDFEIQIPAALDMKANAAFNAAKKQQNKKRKADVFSLSTDSTTSETENVDSTHNTAHYLQLAIDNLMLALNKEIDESIQNKIQFVLAKTQLILLNAADSEFASQLDIQHQIQSIKTDVVTKCQEIQAMISNLQFLNIPAASQLNIAEPASQSASQTSIQSNLTSVMEKSALTLSDSNESHAFNYRLNSFFLVFLCLVILFRMFLL